MASADGKQIDLRDVFNLLESTENHVTEDIRRLIQDNLASTKESWLVNSLVDYYYSTRSQSVVAILTDVREPHDKHVLEKLLDGLKGGDHQLPALQFLLSLVCRPPHWVNKLVHMPVLKVIIKLLKVEINIPVLMTAVSIVTVLLPSIPTLIGPYFPDVFEVFNRLASFSVRKPTGNIPDVFILHLQVAVYALFHRLYGMFPYNFLTYLRYFYTKKDNIAIFDEVVKSMLERVRLHPSLITATTKEQELSTQRWRHMETQDIVVECARLSLDPIEGTWEELHCPIIASRYSLDRTAANHKLPKTKLVMPTGDSSKSRQAVALKAEQSPGHTLENFPFWSPSEVIGLSTPPPSQRHTPATSFVDSALSVSHHPGSTSFVTPQQLSTPANTPRQTPVEDPERALSRNAGRSQSKSTDPKRLSAELTINANIPLLTPSSHNPSIPPSPLKQEFTNTPPLGAVKSLPILYAARELQFDSDQSQEGMTRLNQSNTCSDCHVTKTDERNSRFVAKAAQLGTGVGNESKTEKSDGKVASVSESDVKYVATGMESVIGAPSGANAEVGAGRLKEGAVFIDNLQEIVESFDNHEEDDDDAEVSELTSSTRSTSTTAMLTAESVALFMKSVNRIRFNSLTASNGIEQYQNTKHGMKNRSRSCPQLPKIEPTFEDEEHISRSASTMIHERLLPVTMEEVSCDDSTAATTTTTQDNVCDLSITSTSSTVTVSTKQEVSVTTVTSQSRQEVDYEQRPESAATGNMSYEETQLTQLLKQLLDPRPMCSKCRSLGQSVEEQTRGVTEGNVRPIFSTFSPPELLDRHLRLGGDIHAKELSKIPIPSTQNVNWTHFGGMPPADEISILRTQQMLLHNQLLYERHKREQYAMRNRRLLRKIVNAKSLEEQNKAMTDQLRLNDNTIHNLQVSLKLLHEENRKLRGAQDSHEYEKLVQLRACLQENEDLKSAKKEFNTLLVRQREEQDGLRQNLMSCEAKLLNKTTELEAMRQHAELNVRLKEEVIRLQKELLLMGELQQKSQEKLQSFKISNSVKHEQDYQLDTLRADNKVLKAHLERKTVQLDGSQYRLHDLQDALSQREISLAEVKRNLEMAKTSHDDELRCVEDKHQAMVRINQALEIHLLKLYAEIEELQSRAAPAHSRRKPHNAGTPPDGSGPGSHGNDNHGNDDDQPEPRERTKSDPLGDQRQKSPLTRMGSAPPPDMTQISDKHLRALDTPSQASDVTDHRSQRSDFQSETSGIETEILQTMDPQVLVRRTCDDPSETVSMSSRDSSMYPSNQNLLYTDSEDNQSMSNRSNALSDSGFC